MSVEEHEEHEDLLSRRLPLYPCVLGGELQSSVLPASIAAHPEWVRTSILGQTMACSAGDKLPPANAGAEPEPFKTGLGKGLAACAKLLPALPTQCRDVSDFHDALSTFQGSLSELYGL